MQSNNGENVLTWKSFNWIKLDELNQLKILFWISKLLFWIELINFSLFWIFFKNEMKLDELNGLDSIKLMKKFKILSVPTWKYLFVWMFDDWPKKKREKNGVGSVKAWHWRPAKVTS